MLSTIILQTRVPYVGMFIGLFFCVCMVSLLLMFFVIHNRGDANFRPRLFTLLINFILFFLIKQKNGRLQITWYLYYL